jgi:hypothetical protein
MEYLLLIYNDETGWQNLPADERGKIVEEYFAFTNELRERGAYIGGNPLQPTSAATTVRVRDAESLVTDGPFAETKEQLGGYYLVEADTLDEALEYAAKIPGARYGSIEVRPVMPIPAEAEARR